MTATLPRPDTAAAPAAVRRAPSPRRARRTAVRPRSYRPDIEGMRAIAVVVVVLYHAHLLHVSGGYIGVDVFFVISGYLITRQLVKSVGEKGLRALPTFYTRRIRRLLPAAAVVVVSTVLVARFFAPPLQVRSIALDGLFTTFYGLNYRFAIEGTQYLHANDAVSPLQHFWSLGVEEQFYVVWPVVIALVALIGRRYRRQLMFVLLAAGAAVSYYFSIVVTQSSEPWAYFSLHTRAWELAAGALVALSAERLARLPRGLAATGGWIGLAAVIGSAFAFSDSTAYPGSVSAVPVLGAALLIACGCGPKRHGVERMLGEPAMQCIGRVSYSWYLWHWPMLILAPMVLGHTLTGYQRGVVVLVSLFAAVLTFFVVEDPVRHIAWGNVRWFGGGLLISGSVVAAAMLVVANLPSLVGTGQDAHVIQAAGASSTVDRQMDQAISAGVDVKNAPRNLTPTPDRAAKSLPPADGTNCHAEFSVIDQGACVWGDKAGTHTAVLFGDSHADQWLPAFDAAAKTAHWKVVDWTKSACPAASMTVVNKSLGRDFTECDTWRTKTIARIGTLKPDAVFVSSSENLVDGSTSPQTWSDATQKTLKALRTADPATRVTLLQDIPIPGFQMPQCLSQNLSDVGKCTYTTKKSHSFPSRHRQLAADAKKNNFPVVEPQGWMCTADKCPAIVGNLGVYRDDSHMTVPFSTWLAPRVAPLLVPVKGR